MYPWNIDICELVKLSRCNSKVISLNSHFPPFPSIFFVVFHLFLSIFCYIWSNLVSNVIENVIKKEGTLESDHSRRQWVNTSFLFQALLCYNFWLSDRKSIYYVVSSSSPGIMFFISYPQTFFCTPNALASAPLIFIISQVLLCILHHSF